LVLGLWTLRGNEGAVLSSEEGPKTKDQRPKS
jgi:hypothetical protein